MGRGTEPPQGSMAGEEHHRAERWAQQPQGRATRHPATLNQDERRWKAERENMIDEL